MGMQAALLTSATLSAEVEVLKKDLERTEQELGLAKRQLEEKEGKKIPYRKSAYREARLQKITGLHCLL